MRNRVNGRRAGRRGFTLIELLVVIAIIAVLMGLLMAGVMAVLQAKDRTQNKYDMDKLDESMRVALQDYSQESSLPGYLVLYNNTDVYRKPSAYLTNAADVKDAERSRDALRKMFKNRFITDGPGTNQTPPAGVPWDGTTGTATTNKVVLEGHQCLVFYLGGYCDSSSGTPIMRGFSKNPKNPLDFTTKEVYGPYYNFESNRLVALNGATKQYPAYADRYGTPYAYFGTTGGRNGYVGPAAGTGACPSLVNTADAGYPDAAAGRFMKPDSYQISSAGRDKTFGAPNKWNPSTGSTDGNARDDVGNFSSVPLGNPQR